MTEIDNQDEQARSHEGIVITHHGIRDLDQPTGTGNAR